MHGIMYEKLTVFSLNAMHVARSGNSSGDELPAPGDYRTGCPEGGDIMPEVSWTSETCVGGVSGLVDLFRRTFVFEINSSGRFFIGTGELSADDSEGECRCPVS